MALEEAWLTLKSDFEDIRDDMEHEFRPWGFNTNFKRPYEPRLRARVKSALSREDLNQALESVGETARAKQGFNVDDPTDPDHYPLNVPWPNKLDYEYRRGPERFRLPDEPERSRRDLWDHPPYGYPYPKWGDHLEAERDENDSEPVQTS